MGILQRIPLAAMGDVLEVVIPIAFMILYVVGQLLAGKNQKNQGAPRPKRPNQRPPEPGPFPKVAAKPEGGQAAGKPMRLDEALRLEVDEFLQRAQGKPRQRQPLRPDQVSPAPNRGDGRRDRIQRGKMAPQQGAQLGHLADRSSQTPAQTAGQPQSTIPELTEQEGRSISVADHVAKNISARSRDIGQHAEHLVDELSQTDERVEARLHHKFDHAVGRLKQQEAVERDLSSGIAHEIAQTLAKPEGMRQLIIFNEILRRPHF
jgi:hypothetical protein